MENELFKFYKEKFDKQVDVTDVPDGFTLQDVYDFMVGIYNFTIPEGKEEGESAFGLLDYYNMEYIGAFLRKQQAEMERKDRMIAEARHLFQDMLIEHSKIVDAIKKLGG